MSRWDICRRWGALAGVALLLGCLAGYVWGTRHWPLVNDAALMSYVVFLMRAGLAPYREIGDMNFPGAYGPEWVSMGLAGVFHIPEAAMWRAMDFGVLLLAGLAVYAIAGRRRRFAAVWAGSLFALFHGRDGVGQAGQRDLWMAVLLLWAAAAVLWAVREESGRLWKAALFGLLVGAAMAIKPFGAVYLLGIWPLLRAPERGRKRLLLAAGSGFLLPVAGVLAFLLRWHAMGAFWRVLRVDLPYYAGLADGSPWQLLPAGNPASIAKLLGLLLLVLVFSRKWLVRGAELGLLAGFAALGLLSFIVQGKGYSYQRYPYLAFLFPLAAVCFTEAARSGRVSARAVGAAGLVFGVLFCAPSYLRSALRASWSTGMMRAYEGAMRAQAGPGGLAGLQGQVQCMDAVSGCTDALLQLHLRQATGTMYDEFLFPQTPAPWGTVYSGPAPGTPLPRAVVETRARFKPLLVEHVPKVILVSAWLFPEGPGNYRELELWPWFREYLRAHYVLVSEQSFPTAENGPMGFRVYVRRGVDLR